MSVMRGQVIYPVLLLVIFFIFILCWVFQILNLTQALKDRKSPVQLVQMPVVVIERSRRHSESSSYKQIFSKRAPFFSWC